MKKADIVARLPVIFGLDRLEAAAALGISAPLFDAMVNDGRMRRIERRKVWIACIDDCKPAFAQNVANCRRLRIPAGLAVMRHIKGLRSRTMAKGGIETPRRFSVIPAPEDRN